VSGAAEVNETLTAIGRFGLGNYTHFDVTVRSLRVQRWSLIGVIVAAMTIAVGLTPCFCASGSGEHEGAVEGLERAWGFAMLVSICTSTLLLFSAVFILVLGELCGDDEFTKSWYPELRAIMVGLAFVGMLVPLVMGSATVTLPTRPRVLVVSITVGLELVLTTTVIAASSTRANLAHAFSDVGEFVARLGSSSDTEAHFRAVRGLVPTAAVLNGLVIDVVLMFWVSFLVTMKWCGCTDPRVDDGVSPLVQQSQFHSVDSLRSLQKA
jgi:hypothetical protein